MARWRLMTAHFLNIPGEEWEYQEIDQKTRKTIRQRIAVPKLLDPADPTCWTSRWGSKDNEEGHIVVCHEGKGEPSDQVFRGDPTPDMFPLDDEARELTAKFEERWKFKPEDAAQPFSQSLVNDIERELRIKQQIEDAKPVTAKVDGMAELVQGIGELVAMNKVLLEQQAANNPARRV